MKRVSRGVYQLESAGFVNCYLLEGNMDLTLVDAGTANSAQALLGEIKDNGFKSKDIQRVVITHAHADHAGGLSALLKDHRFKVYAHPKDIPALTGKASPPGFKGLRGFVHGFFHEQFLRWEPIDVALPAERGGGIRGLAQWQVVELPGHTRGSIGLYHPAEQMLLCGDALTNREGKLRLPAAELNEDPEAAQQTLADLARMDCDLLCPGHGPVVRGGAFRHIEKLLPR